LIAPNSTKDPPPFPQDYLFY